MTAKQKHAAIALKVLPIVQGTEDLEDATIDDLVQANTECQDSDEDYHVHYLGDHLQMQDRRARRG